MATPSCIERRDMTLVRKLKNLQEYTEKLESLLQEAHSLIEKATK